VYSDGVNFDSFNNVKWKSKSLKQQRSRNWLIKNKDYKIGFGGKSNLKVEIEIVFKINDTPHEILINIYL